MIHLNTKNIVIPTDFSETSMLAIKQGSSLAQYTKGEVYLVHIISKHWEKFNVFTPTLSLDDIEKASGAVEKKLEELASDIRKEYGVNVTTVVNTGNPTTEVVKFAKEVKAGIVVMGTHGYSAWEDLTIGSNALKVITKNSCPVMTISQPTHELGYHHIVMPIDTSEHSRHKVNFTLELAKLYSSKIHVVGLLASDEESKVPAINLIIHQIQKMAEEQGLICEVKLQENVKNRAIATVEYCNEVNGDLITIMTDQDAEVSGFFLGNYALQVIHHSKVPVISIKPEEHPDLVNYGMLAGT